MSKSSETNRTQVEGEARGIAASERNGPRSGSESEAARPFSVVTPRRARTQVDDEGGRSGPEFESNRNQVLGEGRPPAEIERTYSPECIVGGGPIAGCVLGCDREGFCTGRMPPSLEERQRDDREAHGAAAVLEAARLVSEDYTRATDAAWSTLAAWLRDAADPSNEGDAAALAAFALVCPLGVRVRS